MPQVAKVIAISPMKICRSRLCRWTKSNMVGAVILRQLTALAAAAGLAACAHDPTLAGAIWDVRAGTFVAEEHLFARAAAARHVILGEIHDNAEHHRLQLLVLRKLDGRRILAMEQ